MNETQIGELIHAINTAMENQGFTLNTQGTSPAGHGRELKLIRFITGNNTVGITINYLPIEETP